jgi:hypothetical protein
MGFFCQLVETLKHIVTFVCTRSIFLHRASPLLPFWLETFSSHLHDIHALAFPFDLVAEVIPPLPRRWELSARSAPASGSHGSGDSGALISNECVGAGVKERPLQLARKLLSGVMISGSNDFAVFLLSWTRSLT